MNMTFLETIVVETRERVDLLKASSDVIALKDTASAVRSNAENNRLRSALSPRERPNIIAEIKRASPSKGVINDQVDVARLARDYESGGAAAISVLTESVYFGGSMDDLSSVRATVDLPILCKDFIVDEFQVYEAALAGADAILLIVAALSEEDLKDLLRVVRELKMDALVEVHTANEMGIAAALDADIIGINNRDLLSLEVSLDVSRALINNRPPDTLIVAESGLSSPKEIEELRRMGFNGFLIGEALMRSADPAGLLQNLVEEAAV